MKRLSVVGAIFTSLVLGAAMNAVAQEENKQEEHKQETAQPPARQEQAKPEERRSQPQQNNEERRQEPRQDERQMQQQQEKQQHETKQQEKQQQKMDKQQEQMNRQQGREQDRRQQAQPQQPMQKGQQARAPHRENQRRISEGDFHAHFGREHRFAPGRIQVYEGRPQFTYTGYVFELLNPWPSDWAYDTDDYYVDYFDDEYWLCSFSHPEIRLELIIIG